MSQVSFVENEAVKRGTRHGALLEPPNIEKLNWEDSYVTKSTLGSSNLQTGDLDAHSMTES